MSIERRLHTAVQRIRRCELDTTGDGQRQQSGARGVRAQIHQADQLVGSQHVQQRRCGDQRCVVELGVTQSIDVGLLRLQ
jgi:predicted component of type VI protein secretion system